MDLFKMSNVCWKYLQMFVETRKSDPKVRGIFETCQTYMIELQKTVKTILIPLKPTQKRRSCDVFRDIKKCFLQLLDLHRTYLKGSYIRFSLDKKWRISSVNVWSNPQKTVDTVTFIEKTLYGKLQVLCSVCKLI